MSAVTLILDARHMAILEQMAFIKDDKVVPMFAIGMMTNGSP